MKKNSENLLFILLLLIIPVSQVYADSIILSCPSEIEANSQFVCQITGSTTSGVTSLKATLNLSDDLSFVSFTRSNLWEGGYDNQIKRISLYAGNSIGNNFSIGSLSLKNNGGNNNTVLINEVFFADSNDMLNEVNSVSSVIKIKDNTPTTDKDTNSGSNISNNNNNNNNGNVENNGSNNDNSGIVNPDDDNNEEILNKPYLTDIKIDGYEINFSRDTFKYSLNINDEDSLNIVPVLENSNSSYAISGNENLVNGSVINIHIVSEDGITNDYIIEIVKNNDKNVVKKNNNYKIIFIVIIGILLIVNIVRFILNRRKKDEEV